MPSSTSCCFVMGLSHTSQTSPSAGPPQNRDTLSNGRLAELLADEGTYGFVHW